MLLHIYCIFGFTVVTSITNHDNIKVTHLVISLHSVDDAIIHLHCDIQCKNNHHDVRGHYLSLFPISWMPMQYTITEMNSILTLFSFTLIFPVDE